MYTYSYEGLKKEGRRGMAPEKNYNSWVWPNVALLEERGFNSDSVSKPEQMGRELPELEKMGEMVTLVLFGLNVRWGWDIMFKLSYREVEIN